MAKIHTVHMTVTNDFAIYAIVHHHYSILKGYFWFLQKQKFLEYNNSKKYSSFSTQ